MERINLIELKNLTADRINPVERKEVNVHIRRMFDGMLSGAIKKFEALISAAKHLNPVVEKGYDVTQGKDSYFAWGCACRITCDDMAALKVLAKGMGITWLSDDGDMAFTNKLTIKDFKTNRVNGELALMPEESDEPNSIEPKPILKKEVK